MAKINYFIFFDLETTGFPWAENNRTKITELSMVAVSRKNLLNNVGKGIPRVTHRLTLCFDPKRMINHVASEKTGLWNMSLDEESSFDKNTASLIELFLGRLQPPICFVAHNGYKFDYPIFNTHILKNTDKINDNFYCIDSLLMFRTLILSESDVTGITQTPSTDECDFNGKLTAGVINNIPDIYITPVSTVMITPESTPVKCKKRPSVTPNFTPESNGMTSVKKKSKITYKLEDIYTLITGRPPVDTHRAECDCMFLLECFSAKADDFIDWCDENKVLLKEIDSMKVGEKFPNFTPGKTCNAKRSLVFDEAAISSQNQS